MKYLVLVIFLIVSLACSESNFIETAPSVEGLDYFPLEVGQMMMYQLDSIIYDPEPGEIVVDTIRYHLKYEIIDSFVDAEGDKAFKIDRFLRKKIDDPWEISDVWTVKIADGKLIWTEENIPYIKLVFPFNSHTRWDGNALFDDDRIRINVRGETIDMFKFWGNYEGESIADEQIGGVDYIDVFTVTQVDKEISIEKRFSQEKYAKGIGLVHQKIIILDTQNENAVIPFEDRAESGFIVVMTRLK